MNKVARPVDSFGSKCVEEIDECDVIQIEALICVDLVLKIRPSRSTTASNTCTIDARWWGIDCIVCMLAALDVLCLNCFLLCSDTPLME